MFSIDTETGFPDAVLINAAWGLGETVVQGLVDPDEYMVFKPLLGKRRLYAHHRKDARARRSKKLVYATQRRQTPRRWQDHRESERRAHVLDDDADPDPGPLGGGHRGALRPPHGHRMGQGRQDR